MAHGHYDVPTNFVQRFEVTSPLRRIILGLFGVGALCFVLGLIFAAGSGGGNQAPADHGHEGDAHHSSAIVHLAEHHEGDHATNHGDDHGDGHGDAHHAEGHAAHGGHGDHGHHYNNDWHHLPPAQGHGPQTLGSRLWSALLYNGFFFMGIGLLSMFFMAVSTVSNAGWFVIFKRLGESMAVVVPVFAVLLLVVFFLGQDYLWFWADPEIASHDELIQKKQPFLSTGFFTATSIGTFIIWTLLILRMWSLSKREDEQGGIKPFNSYFNTSLAFILIFALSFSVASWQWIMSIDAHWFSTMFAVRTFSSCFVTALALMALGAIFLRTQGFLPHFNKSHQHDLGKFIFGFSIFWAYIWVGEFLLIWYANIPEEGLYFVDRTHHFWGLFISVIILNFAVPFLGLMTNAAKRNDVRLVIVCLVILIGHWLEWFLFVTPGITFADTWKFGLLEVGVFLLFFGTFVALVAQRLKRVNLVAKNHPYLKESLIHHYEI